MSPQRRKPLPGRLERTEAFQVAGLPAQYPLTVYLPPDYDTSDRDYPVAYMFDGQNLYGDEGSYSGGWYVDKALDKRHAKGLETPVVIGIHHGGSTRLQEFCPWGIEGRPGQGDQFLDWLTGELMAWVEARYRIRKGVEHTMIGGSSLGGLMSLYAFFRHPDTFGQVMSMSPSLWVYDGIMIRYAERAPLSKTRRIYIDAGGKEQRTMVKCQAMVEMLRGKGLVQRDDLYWRPDPQAEHTERAWRRRVPKAFEFLYD